MGKKTEQNTKSREKPSLAVELAQSLYPKEIRIRKYMKRDDLEKILGQVDQVVVQWLEEQKQKQEPEISNRPIEPLPLDDQEFFKKQMELAASVATGLWRMKQRLVNPETGQPYEETRRTFRHFQSVWDALEQNGYTIQDHTGQPFSAHQQLKVITYEEKKGIEREMISETIKPSVYYEKDGVDTLIQMGEVIVATPVSINE
jgi:hypothetical protein